MACQSQKIHKAQKRVQYKVKAVFDTRHDTNLACEPASNLLRVSMRWCIGPFIGKR